MLRNLRIITKNCTSKIIKTSSFHLMHQKVSHISSISFKNINLSYPYNACLFRPFTSLSNETSHTPFYRLASEINDGLKIAQEKNKKLLMLAGEEHGEGVSFMLEVMLLLLARNHGIKHLILEFPDFLLDLKDKVDPSASNILYIAKIAKERFNMDIHAADDGIAALLLSVNENSSSMITDINLHERRENKMINECVKINDHAIFILGTGHLQGLMLNEKLEETYHIVGLNLTSLSPIGGVSYNPTSYFRCRTVVQIPLSNETYNSKYKSMDRQVIIEDLENEYCLKPKKSLGR